MRLSRVKVRIQQTPWRVPQLATAVLAHHMLKLGQSHWQVSCHELDHVIRRTDAVQWLNDDKAEEFQAGTGGHTGETSLHCLADHSFILVRLWWAATRLNQAAC